MNLEGIETKSIAMIVWNTEKENDVHVYLGKLQVKNGKHHFVNEEKAWRVSLNEEQLNRLQPVSDDLKETLLNADYALSVTMSDLPQPNSEDFTATGMRWHD